MQNDKLYASLCSRPTLWPSSSEIFHQSVTAQQSSMPSVLIQPACNKDGGAGGHGEGSPAHITSQKQKSWRKFNTCWSLTLEKWLEMITRQRCLSQKQMRKSKTVVRHMGPRTDSTLFCWIFVIMEDKHAFLKHAKELKHGCSSGVTSWLDKVL